MSPTEECKRRRVEEPAAQAVIRPVADEDLKAQLKLPAQTGFRNYEDSLFQDRVQRTYYNMHSLQTVDGVRVKLAAYRKLDKAVLSVEEMMKYLATILDESDPDNDLPQSYHAYQTAESVMQRYFSGREPNQVRPDISLETFFTADEWASLPAHAQALYKDKTLATHFPHIKDWSWFPLTALIHDLGKVCMEKEYGGMPQWSAVGDTFVLGCDFDPANVFHAQNFYSKNPDASNSALQGKCGMYKPNCGLDNVVMSFGHDEYMALVLEGHAQDVERRRAAGESVPAKELPKEATYMIRFHSFYPWHTPRSSSRGYTHLASEQDWRMLPLLKALQKSDLYSKTKVLPDIPALQVFYGQLIRDHFLPTLRW